MGQILLQVVLIVMGFLVLYVTFLRPRRELRGKPDLDPSPGARRREAQELRDEIDEVFVRLQQYSRETLAKLDTKIRLLHQLIQDADARIQRLEEGERRGPAPDGPPSPAVPEGRSTGGEAGLPVAVADRESMPPPSAAPERSAPSLPSHPIHRKVCELHDRGLTLPEIEAEVGIGKGEVELILGMRRLGASRGGSENG